MEYNVLIVEDNKSDARLMKEYLHRSGEEFGEIELVHDKGGYRKALQDQNRALDLVISDYRMVQFNGLDAIRMKNDADEELPIVIVSATIGEEKAVELIREGAVDFLMKENCEQRLAQVAMRAIRESREKKKRRRAEQALQKSLQRYRMLFDSSLDGIMIGNPHREGKVIDANEALCHMLGYELAELKTLKRKELFTQESSSLKKLIEKRERGKKGIFKGELNLKHKNGDIIPVEVTSRIIEMGEGGEHSFSIIRDIRERKKVEKQLQQDKEIQNLQKDIAQILNRNTTFRESLQQCITRISQFLGWPIGHVYLKNTMGDRDTFIPLDLWYRSNQSEALAFMEKTRTIGFSYGEGYIGKVAQTNTPMEFHINNGLQKVNYLRRDAAVRSNIKKGILVPVVVDGSTEAVLEFYTHTEEELTPQLKRVVKATAGQIVRLIERKENQAKLEKQVKLNDTIINSLPGLFFIMSEDQKIRRINDQFMGKLGYKKQDIIQMDPLEFVAESDRQSAYASLKTAFREGHVEVELNLLTKAGNTIPYLMSGTVRELDGTKYLLGTGIDIADRVQAEQELMKEKEFTEKALNSLPGLFYVLDSDQNYARVNENFVNQLGYSWEELVDMHPLQFYKEEDQESVIKAIERAFNEGEATLESQLKTKDGTLPWYFLTGTHIRQDDKDFILGTGIDITERKKLEDLLQQAHQLARIGAWELDLMEGELSWTPVTKQIHEVEPDYEPDLKTAIKFYKEGESRQTIQRVVSKAIEYGIPYDVELQIITAKGNDRWIRAIGETEFRDGKCVKLYGSFQDIHAQKMVEDQLKSSLKEKEVLLMEIHHRVKNNLAVVSSMMQLQAYDTDSEEARSQLINGQSRIKSIALMHELLYESKSFSELYFDENITELYEHISNSMQSDVEVEVSFDLDSVELNINQAIPCSLILNELLTNIYKHAFEGCESGEINIILKEKGKDVELSVSDNGIGLPDDFDLDNPTSIGLKILTVLTQQLEGEFSYNSGSNGTRFTLVFQKKDIKGSASSLV